MLISSDVLLSHAIPTKFICNVVDTFDWLLRFYFQRGCKSIIHWVIKITLITSDFLGKLNTLIVHFVAQYLEEGGGVEPLPINQYLFSGV